MKKILLFIPALVLFTGLAFLPDSTSAAALVPCDGINCSFCHFVELGNNVLTWIFGIVFVIFGIIVFIAGFGLATSGGNQTSLDEAKKKLSNAVIGLIIVFAAWLIVDTVMKALVADGNVGTAVGVSTLGPWNRIDCGVAGQATPQQPVPGATTTAQAPNDCSDDAALMAQYNGSPVNVNAPGLDTLISCYRSDPAIAAILDTSQIYTFERSDPRCALTNGNSVCGLRCDHSVNSCHYGRGSGRGAMAVDFNVNPTRGTEQQLYNLIRARSSVCGGNLLFENSHTHISMSSC